MSYSTFSFGRICGLECGDFAQVRNNCFHVNNMKELFQDIHIDSIMTFLRQINLFNKI